MGTTIYKREVRLPEGDDLERAMKVYEMLGFPGAYCSADGVHVPWDRAPAKNHHLYVGKEVVRRGIPNEEACDGLVELIKEHGMWKEKEEEEVLEEELVAA